MRTIAASLPLALALVTALPAVAGSVELKDGRTFTGDVSVVGDEVTVDTIVGSIRAKLTFPASEAAKVDASPAPDGYFDEPAAPARKGGSGARGETLYVVVPIDGQFGKQVVATGVGRALSYAVRNHIRHVVFDVNTRDHASVEEAAAIFKVLLRYRDQVQLHALVRSGLGDGLGVIAACHTIHVVPGASIGGAPDPAPEGVDPDEHEALKRERGRKAERALVGMGRANGGKLIRAMLDPDDALAGWRDDEGLHLGPAAPEGVTPIFSSRGGQPLVLDPAAISALGIASAKDVAALGQALSLPGWKAEGDFGARGMSSAAEAKTAAAAKKEAQAAAKVEKVATRRQEVVDALRHDLQEAAANDPNKGDYSTYQRTTWWDWGSTSTVDTQQLTADSQARWTQRSDLTARYLQRALKDLKALERLEADAKKVGLDPIMSPSEIAAMRDDIVVKGKTVTANRIRKER